MCISHGWVGVLWPLGQSLVRDTSIGDERAPQGCRWGTGQVGVQGEEAPNRQLSGWGTHIVLPAPALLQHKAF